MNKIAVAGWGHMREALMTCFERMNNELVASVSVCDVCWIAIDTPVNEKGQGDIELIFDTMKDIKPYLKDGTLVVVSSQIPVGTSKKIVKLLGKNFGYAYMPEHMRIGKGVEDFMNLKEVVIGVDNDKYKKIIQKIFKGKKVVFTSVATAEMIKHATNAFLATSLSFTYDISDLCLAVGADVMDVMRALKSDYRIGKEAYLDTSLGFSGGHLERDLDYLKSVAEEKGCDIPVIRAVIEKNNRRFTGVVEALGVDYKITFWGISYKPGVPADKSSLAVKLMKELKRRGVDVRVDDYEGSQAIMCITPTPEMKNIDFKKVAEAMEEPKVFFDARNYFKDMDMSMFQYVGVGR